jgi:hypothetical protein
MRVTRTTPITTKNQGSCVNSGMDKTLSPKSGRIRKNMDPFPPSPGFRSVEGPVAARRSPHKVALSVLPPALF